MHTMLINEILTFSANYLKSVRNSHVDYDLHLANFYSIAFHFGPLCPKEQKMLNLAYKQEHLSSGISW